MEMQKVLLARVKGDVGDAETMTRYILKGLSCGVLVLPDEVTFFSVQELPVLHELSLSLTESLVRAGLLDEEHIGKPSAGDPATEVSAVEVVPLNKNEKPESASAPDKPPEVLPTPTFQEKEKTESADESPTLDPAVESEKGSPEQATGSFKPKGGQAEIKRETYKRLEHYKNQTGLRWAQRVSDATGGRVSPDIIRRGLLEARDIGIERWKLIGKALDKLEEDAEK